MSLVCEMRGYVREEYSGINIGFWEGWTPWHGSCRYVMRDSNGAWN